MTRPLALVALGSLILSAALAVGLAACSSLSPNPPDPHVIDGDPDLAALVPLLTDGGADGDAPDGSGP